MELSDPSLISFPDNEVLEKKLKYFLGLLRAWINETFRKNQFFDSLKMLAVHCVKIVRIRNFSGPYFPPFGLNTKRYSVSLRIQSECGKIRTRKTPNMDTFHAVVALIFKKIDPIDKVNYSLISILPLSILAQWHFSISPENVREP